MLAKQIITTERLKLRPIESEDESFLIQLWTDLLVRQHLGGPLDQEKAKEQAKEYVGKEGYFVITDLLTGEVFGLCSLDKYRTGDIEVSYQLLPNAWGSGYGQEAVKAVIQWGFANMHIAHIIAVTQTTNHKSTKLLESVGMVKVDEFVEFNEPQTMHKIKKNN